MNMKEMCVLRDKCDRAVKSLDTAINMLPSGYYRIGLTKTQALEIEEVLCEVAQCFDWKLENTEVKFDGGNKGRSKRKRK